MKKELKLKKSCKHIVLNIDLQRDPYTSFARYNNKIC